MRGYQLIVLLTFATSAARGCDAAAALHLHCSTLTRVCYRIASCVDCRRIVAHVCLMETSIDSLPYEVLQSVLGRLPFKER